MKNIMTKNGVLALTALFMLSMLATSCKRNKEAEVKEPVGEVVINEYCSGDAYFSDGTTFRSNATGESMSRETAKKIARSNAESELARTISATLQVVTDNYVNSTKFNNKEEVTETFNDLARTVVDQEINGAITICDKLTQKVDQNYVSYVAIEMSAEELANAYNERLSKDERIKAEYNYEKFKETFNAEMEKLGN